MDQTVIKTFKSKYTKLLMHKLVREVDVHKFLTNLGLKDSIPMMGQAWDAVENSTMKKSWHKLLNWVEGMKATAQMHSPK